MGNPVNVQANLPVRRNIYQILLDGIVGQNVRVDPPKLIEANGVASEHVAGLSFRFIQNCGTVPVKFLVSDDTLCTDTIFHGILYAGNSQDDGAGAQGDFSRVEGRVSVFGVGGNPRVAIFQAIAPEGLGL